MVLCQNKSDPNQISVGNCSVGEEIWKKKEKMMVGSSQQASKRMAVMPSQLKWEILLSESNGVDGFVLSDCRNQKESSDFYNCVVLLVFLLSVSVWVLLEKICLCGGKECESRASQIRWS